MSITKFCQGSFKNYSAKVALCYLFFVGVVFFISTVMKYQEKLLTTERSLGAQFQRYSLSWDRIGKGHVEVAWGQGHLLRISHVAASPGGRDLRWKQEQF